MSGIDRECLRRSLNSLCEFLDIEYKINEGGCCWIASEIARHLDELKIPYAIQLFGSNPETMANASKINTLGIPVRVLYISESMA